YADGVRLLKTHPSQPSDIFAGQDFVMLTRYDRDGTTRLHFTGTTANGPVEWTSRVVFPSSSRENSFIARLWATQRVGYLSAEKRRHGGSSEVDDEIRELGERYGIPTEFSSYLVLEPGMDPRRQRRAANAPPPAMLEGRLGGVVADAAAAPSAKSTFESARASADQRAATTLSAADEASGVSRDKEGLRRAGNRLFVMRDSVWTDTGLKETMQRVKVRAYSAAWFRLVDLLPELREAFALGQVIVAGRAIAVEISPTGVESLSESELRSLQSKW
ncbi:MAG: hypothetical protein ABIU86_02875, partial [Gemmatimonadaceae bacterium]